MSYPPFTPSPPHYLTLRKLGTETLIYGLSNILGRLLNFVLVTYFISRLMSDVEFGIVGDLMFWTALLIALLVFRMDTAVFRFASRAEYDGGAVFRRAQTWVIGGVVLVAGGLLLAAPWVADWVNYPDRVVWVRLVLFTVAFDVLAMVPLARLRLENRAWTFVAVNLGNVAINIVLIFLLLYVWRWNADWVAEHWGLRYDPLHQVTYYLVSIMAASAFRYLVLLIDGLRRRETKEGAAPTLRTMLNYSTPLTVVAVAGIINFLVAPAILKYYNGGAMEDNLGWSGQFNAAIKLAVVLNLFITAYTYAAEPFFFRQAGKNLATADKTIYADATRAFGIVGALASAGILLYQPWLELMVGPGVRKGLVILPVLLAANFFFGLYSNFSIAYKLTDKTILGGAIAATGSVIVLGGSILFTRTYSIYAPAVAMLVCFIVMCGLAWWVSRRYFPVDYPLGRILLYLLLTGAAVWLGAELSPYQPLTHDPNFTLDPTIPFVDSVFRPDVGAGAGAIAVRTAVFLTLLLALTGLEWNWLRRTFASSPSDG